MLYEFIKNALLYIFYPRSNPSKSKEINLRPSLSYMPLNMILVNSITLVVIQVRYTLHIHKTYQATLQNIINIYK